MSILRKGTAKFIIGFGSWHKLTIYAWNTIIHAVLQSAKHLVIKNYFGGNLKYWSNYQISEPQSKTYLLCLGNIPVRHNAMCSRSRFHPKKMASPIPVTLLDLRLDLINEREMSCQISGGTFEWTRPPDWPEHIRQLPWCSYLRLHKCIL